MYIYIIQHMYMVVVSQFNGTSTTPKGSYSAKTGDNDCNVNLSRYSLRTALCESIRYQAKSEPDKSYNILVILSGQLNAL